MFALQRSKIRSAYHWHKTCTSNVNQTLSLARKSKSRCGRRVADEELIPAEGPTGYIDTAGLPKKGIRRPINSAEDLTGFGQWFVVCGCCSTEPP